MEPPIHVECLHIVGTMILVFIVGGANAVISFCILSVMPGYMVLSPDKMVLVYRSLRMSTLHFTTGLMDTGRLHSKKGWLEQSFRTIELFIVNDNYLTIRNFITALHAEITHGRFHVLLSYGQSYVRI